MTTSRTRGGQAHRALKIVKTGNGRQGHSWARIPTPAAQLGGNKDG
jgi:hypothetical protein